MNDLQIFENPEFGQVRTVEIDGTPWLVGKDVAAALEYNTACSSFDLQLSAAIKSCFMNRAYRFRIYGEVITVKEKTFIVKIADNTRIEIIKSAVSAAPAGEEAAK